LAYRLCVLCFCFACPVHVKREDELSPTFLRATTLWAVIMNLEDILILHTGKLHDEYSESVVSSLGNVYPLGCTKASYKTA
jgi:hypothetical protein